jgi:hypothetical protein
MNDDIKQNLSEAIKDGFTALVTEAPKGKIPEDIFIGYFLPFFAGEKTADRNQPVFAQWVSIAGSPTAAVDIIDKDGSVKVTVPGLFNSDIMRSQYSSDVSMRSIFEQYELYNNNLPVVANNFLDKAFTAKTNNLKPITINKSEEDWQKVLSMYGYKTKASLKNIPTSDTDNDIDYD